MLRNDTWLRQRHKESKGKMYLPPSVTNCSLLVVIHYSSSITTLLQQLIVIAIFNLLEATSVVKIILAGCLQCILLSLKMYLKAMPN